MSQQLSNMTSTTTSNKTVYFGYGSNLWRHQMSQRCPTSKYLGIARLKGYKWIIYDRGYANIVELEEDKKNVYHKHDYTKEVWGLVYSLQEEDERKLDGNEGVPRAYKKEWIECEFWPTNSTSTSTSREREAFVDVTTGGTPDLSQDPDKVDMLIYINRDMVKETKPKKEYVYRMNMGIKDAVKEGMPEEYVKQVMRKFIPEEAAGGDGEVVQKAWSQAAEFRSEAREIE